MYWRFNRTQPFSMITRVMSQPQKFEHLIFCMYHLIPASLIVRTLHDVKHQVPLITGSGHLRIRSILECINLD